jgi:uncharacterized protein (TIGR00251 family)
VTDIVSALTQRPDGVLLKVRVTPRAGRNEVGELRAGRLQVRVTVAPDDGRANVAVVRLVGKALGVPPSSIEIVAGTIARDKTLLLAATTVEEVLAAAARL